MGVSGEFVSSSKRFFFLEVLSVVMLQNEVWLVLTSLAACSFAAQRRKFSG
jgi:hypothetical protein